MFLKEPAALGDNAETDEQDYHAECNGQNADGRIGELEKSMAAIPAAVGNQQKHTERPIDYTTLPRVADVIPSALWTALGHRLHCETSVGLRSDRGKP